MTQVVVFSETDVKMAGDFVILLAVIKLPVSW